jgi:hypothetical protein
METQGKDTPMSNVAIDQGDQETEQREHSLAVIQPEPAPALAGPRLSLPTMQELDTLKAYGQLVVDSGMAPAHVKTWEAAVVIMRYGHQLGVDEFTALQNMYVIQGKPAMQASLMHAMILRAHGPNAIQLSQFDAKACVLECRPRGARKPTIVSYSIEEAAAAGLAGKDMWKKYPADLLFARAVSRAGRLVFRDVTMGMYVPEELDGNVIEVDGEVVDLDQEQRHVHIRELRKEHEAEKDAAAAHDDEPVQQISDDEFGRQVRDAMVNRDADQFRELIDKAGEEIGRWTALVQASESAQALEWIKRQIERKGIQDEQLERAVIVREEQITGVAGGT